MYVYILAAVGTLGASTLRVVQNLIMIEPVTGLFRNGYETANVLIITAVFVIIAIAALFARICRDVPEGLPEKTRPFAVVHYVLAVSIMLETFLTEVSAATPAWQIIVHIILATLAALVLIIGGTSLAVYPAASLIDYFKGDKLVVINMAPTPRDQYADLVIQAPIGEVFRQL